MPKSSGPRATSRTAVWSANADHECDQDHALVAGAPAIGRGTRAR